MFLAHAVWLAAASLIVVGVVRFFTVRRFYRGLPGPPHSLLLGHLKIIGEYMRRMPPGSHVQAAITQIQQDYNLPDIFYLDLWPIGPRFVVCSGADAAATVSTFPQSTLVLDVLGPTIGTTFIEVTNGPLWKNLHRVFAPSLTPASVKGYHDGIVDEAAALHARLHARLQDSDVVDLNYELGKFTFGVVCNVVGITVKHGAYDWVRRATRRMGVFLTSNNPITQWVASRDVKRYLKSAAAGMEVLPRGGLPENVLFENAIGFIIAGTGSTADILSYAFMLLGSHPDALQKVRDEHDRVLDLRNGHKELKYTTAVIQETLRLFPVGMVVRAPQDATIQHRGKTYNVENQQIMVPSHTLHYNAEYFDEPAKFKPERFLGEIPRNAYRPFERGLRSCLGQNLAMEEMRMALVMLARSFDFELQEPVLKQRFSHTELDTKIGVHAFQGPGFTAGPHGPVMMKVTKNVPWTGCEEISGRSREK
ncbi:cytochrome P450 [Coniochaeta sp. 2T2.1]|nr:cytochrome P450 [Coniochaeta sp. 2T2.1]